MFGLALCALFATDAVRATEPCEARREYDGIMALVTEQFYDKTFRGIDWPARVASNRNQVACGDSDSAVATQVNTVLSSLHASHTGLYTKRDLEYWGLQSIFSRKLDAFPIALSGIWPKQVGTAWYAAYVLDDSPAARAGVRAGDLLVSLDGGTFGPLGFRAQTESTLVISSDGHSQRTVRFTPTLESAQSAFVRASAASERQIPVDRKRVGYVHLWAGTHVRFRETLESALAHLETAQVDALIVDLRGGYGGSGPEYLAKLKSSERFARVPKYFLIDDGVRSGKEWVAAMVRQQKLGTLVGSTTSGSFLAGRPNQPFDGKYFLYVATEPFTPEGIPPIEGIGVPPDVPIAPCRMFCAGEDPQLAKALELFRLSAQRAAS
jgi:carboxyl-terminal processing protease